MKKCADCDRQFTENERRIIKSSSIRLSGVYYQGPPICEDCSKKRYDAAIRKLESEQVEDV